MPKYQVLIDALSRMGFSLEEIGSFVPTENMDKKGKRAAVVKTKDKDGPFLFERMRRMADMGGWAWSETAIRQNFIRQSAFMREYDREYEGFAPYNVDFRETTHAFSSMSDEQLRTYFSFRAGVRKGEFRKTSSGYVFTLLREELYNDLQSPDLPALIAGLLSAYCESNPEIVVIVHEICAALYPARGVQESIAEWMRRCGVKIEDQPYPMRHRWLVPGSLDYAFRRASYTPRGGAYYNEAIAPRFERCYDECVTALGRWFDAEKLKPEYLLWGRPAKTYGWHAIWDGDARVATLYPREGEYVVSSVRRVVVKQGTPTMYAADPNSATGNLFIGYLLKRIEAQMRAFDKFRYRLRPNPTTLYADLQSYGLRYKPFFTRLQAGAFDEVIDEAVLRALAPHVAVKRVSLDASKLDAIRQEAEETRERLYVPEQEESAPAVPVPAPEPENVQEGWDGFLEALGEKRGRALMRLLAGKSLREAADEAGEMEEVFVEAVNERALEALGDNVLDAESGEVYEEYRAEMRARLERM